MDKNAGIVGFRLWRILHRKTEQGKQKLDYSEQYR
jgi:hypothetical protein